MFSSRQLSNYDCRRDIGGGQKARKHHDADDSGLRSKANPRWLDDNRGAGWRMSKNSHQDTLTEVCAHLVSLSTEFKNK